MAGRSSTIRVNVLSDTRGLQRGIDGVNKKLGTFGSTVKRTAGLAVGYLGGRALLDGVKDITRAASDAQQSIGATETVFGKYAKTVERTSKAAAGAFGLSANDYRENANLLGALFSNQGVAQDKLAGKTKNMIGVASDLAATFGGATSDAVAALGSAFKGEFDPLEKYGISLKASSINALLSKRGQDKLTGAMLDQAKQVAASDLIMKQSRKTRGAFGKESNTLAGQQQRLAAKIENVKSRLGTMLLPILTDLARYVQSDVLPAVEDFIAYLEDSKPEIQALASSIKDEVLPVLADFADVVRDDLWPVLKTLGETVGALVGFLADLPDPLKKGLIQAGLAYIAFKKLSGIFGGASTALSGFTGKMKDAKSRTAALKSAARSAAGAGGLLLLTKGISEADSSLGLLESTAGGALLGFSLGGPWGAAIGAGAGALSRLWTANEKVRESLLSTKDIAELYADSIDSVTGAANRKARESVFTQLKNDYPFVVEAADKLHLSMRDIVSATLGNASAQERVNTAIKNGGREWDEYTNGGGEAMGGLLKNAIGSVREDFRKTTREQRKTIEATQSWSEALRGVPKRVQTALKQEGYRVNLREINRLQREYNLTPKQVRTVAKAVGFDLTRKEAKNLGETLKDTGKVKPNLQPFLGAFGDIFGKTKTKTRTETGGLTKLLTSGWAPKAKPDMGPFKTAVTSGVSSAQEPAYSLAVGVGSSVKTGVLNGVSGLSGALSAETSTAVRNAIDAARAEADIHSPSRKMRKIGRQLAAGLVAGMADGRSGVSRATEKITRVITRTLRKGNRLSKAEVKANVKIVESWLKANRKQLTSYAVQIERAESRVAKAERTLADRIRASKDYARSIREAMVSYADVTGFETEEGEVTAADVIRGLKDKVNAAKRYASLMRRLTKLGLNKTMLQQLADAGVEGGLATAEALAAGGKSAIGQVNTLSSQLGTTASGLGESLAKTMHGAGIKAATGLVKGLRRKESAIERQAERFAKKLTTAMKKALKIKSPSRVFEEIGLQTVKGLQIGLDDTYAKQGGVKLADALTSGFSRPQLTAEASAGGAGGGNTYQISVQAPVGSSGADIGRTIVKHIEEYERLGGRRRA